MPLRTLEGDALQEMILILNQGITDQGEPAILREAMPSANFVSHQTVRNAISKGSDSDISPKSALYIMSAVKSHISTQSTQKIVTQNFNEFVCVLLELRLDNLAQQLVDKLREKKPSYKSPLDEETFSGTILLSGPVGRPAGGPVGPVGGPAVEPTGGPTRTGQPAGASVGATRQFSTNMTVDELHSWLLSNNMLAQDCKLIKDRNINGMAFKLITGAQWETFGLSFGGLVILKHILKQIFPVPSRAAKGSTSNGALRNGSNGAQNGVSSQRNGTHLSGRTIIKGCHYGRLCEQLRPCAAKWEHIAKSLGFKGHEIANIKADPTKLMNAPGSYIDAIIDRWLNWAPCDARGSKDYATLEALNTAVDKVYFPDSAPELTL